MGVATYSDEEDHTVYHTRPRASPTAKLFRRLCEVVLFFMCLAVIGGIVMGVVAIHNAAASNGPEDEGVHARKLFARSYYDSILVSGTSSPRGTAPNPMNNATVVMNTTSGALPSGPFPTATVTVDGVGDFGSTEPSTEAGVSAADVTVTVTSTSTTVTNTRTVTASQVLSVASVAPSTGESTPSVFVTDSAGNCAPTTVTLTVAETVNPATAAQVNSTAKHEAPFTTLIIPDLYSKGEKPTQSVFSAHALNVTEETTTVTAEVTETVTVTASDTNIVNKEIPATTAQSDGELTSAGGSDSTVTVTVFEQPTVIITSTMIADSETPSPAISTNTAGILSHSCASGNITEATSPRATVTLFKVVTETYTTTVDGSASLVTGVKTILTTEVVGVGKTVFATGTIAALSNTVASLMTVTVQPAPEVTQPAPEATQASPGDGTSPAAIPEESSSTQGKRAFGAVIIGCIVVLATTVLCML